MFKKIATVLVLSVSVSFVSAEPFIISLASKQLGCFSRPKALFLSSNCLENRGTYGGITIQAWKKDLTECQDQLLELRDTFELDESVILVEEGISRQLIVVEQVLTDKDDGASIAAWHDKILRATEITPSLTPKQFNLGLSLQIKVIAEEPGRVILSTSDSDLLSLLPFIPPNSEIVPVPDFAVTPILELPKDHPVMELLKNLEHKDDIQNIINKVNISRLEEDVIYLTGEREDSPLRTRMTTSKDAIKAAKWIQSKFDDHGCETQLTYFKEGFSPNVICTYQGTTYPEELVILGAHYDSRGTQWGPRAPGADDDGSGTAMLLQITSLISALNITFDRTVQVIAFSGEEQGLYGSRAYAKKLEEESANVILMIQGDMLAYRKEGEPMQCGFPDRYATIEVTALMKNLTNLYSPELVVGSTLVCCSDHQSFWERGFPATQFFERNGYIADPKYHNSEDLVYRPGYSLKQLKEITKAMFSAIMEIAKYSKNEL